MCGVAGVFHYGDPGAIVDAAALARMGARLAHRGPDGDGTHLDGPLGLAHRRLAIVDLSPTGAQPMALDGGVAVIAYNGELYNHATFRHTLQTQGHAFRGTSDTETLLHMLYAWGPGVLRQAAGIFAFAYWEREPRRLLLARDPIGVKQMYFHDDGRRIVFGSEIKALLEYPGVPREIDPEALNEYLHFHTPLFDRTFFKGIRQVRPGEFLEISSSGVRAKRYWALEGAEPDGLPAAEQVERLKHLLSEIVSEQLMSDVPVGCFFSGGIDSTAVAAFARRAGRPLRLFGVHFAGQGVIDERPFQEQAARALGLELELITLDGSTLPEDLLRLMWHQDEPVIGSALLPMYHVSRLASRKVKVCLGGQAADEIFAGYARYALVHPRRVLQSWMRSRLRRVPGSGGGDGVRVGGNLGKQLLDPRNLRRLVQLGANARTWEGRYFDNFAHVPERSWLDVFRPSIVSRQVAREQFLEVVHASAQPDPADRVLYWDVSTYLPGLFQQEDRMSMASSLESRVPLADPRLVKFAFHVPFALKMKDGASKWILRQAVADVLPEAVLNRRKVGFDTPAEAWLTGPHADFLRDVLLSSAARARPWWDGAALARAVEDRTDPFWFSRVWKLLSIEIWAKVFLDGEAPALPAAA